MHKMGAVRVWRGEGDESKDQGEAFDKWLEVMWANLTKLEAAARAEAGEDELDAQPDEEEEDYDDEDDDEGEPLVCDNLLLLPTDTECYFRLIWKILGPSCRKVQQQTSLLQYVHTSSSLFSLLTHLYRGNKCYLELKRLFSPSKDTKLLVFGV